MNWQPFQSWWSNCTWCTCRSAGWGFAAGRREAAGQLGAGVAPDGATVAAAAAAVTEVVVAVEAEAGAAVAATQGIQQDPRHCQ